MVYRKQTYLFPPCWQVESSLRGAVISAVQSSLELVGLQSKEFA